MSSKAVNKLLALKIVMASLLISSCRNKTKQVEGLRTSVRAASVG